MTSSAMTSSAMTSSAMTSSDGVGVRLSLSSHLRRTL